MVTYSKLSYNTSQNYLNLNKNNSDSIDCLSDLYN